MFTRTKLGITLVSAALALTAALTGCSASTADTGKPGSAPSAAETPETPGLNTPVTVGEFEFTAIAAKDAGTTIGKAPLSQTAQGTFFQVDLKVANIGKKSQTFIASYVKVQDAEGNTYDADLTAGIYVSGAADTWLAAINPGNAVEGPVLFDLPVGTKPVTLLVSDNAFSDGTPITIG